MKYLIHTMPARYWYVTDYLIPSMLQQGIKFDDIDIYTDAAGEGCLKSTLKSFKARPDTGYTWHIQDDVIISSSFKEVTEYIQNYEGNIVVCGFASCYDKHAAATGTTKPEHMWYSFPCIGIPNVYAHEFVEWIENNDDESDLIYIHNNMFDDYLFKRFMQQEHPKTQVFNLNPNIVNNIDYLIGGSIISKREEKIESLYWCEPELIEDLKERLK